MPDPTPEIKPQQPVAVDLTLVQQTTKLVCVAGGKYLGSITYDVIDPQALGALAQLFQRFAAQQSSGIQVSNGAGIPGLRRA